MYGDRYSYLKILLYRPILAQTLRNSNATLCSESNDSTHQAPLHSRVNLDCSIYCVNAAIDLISLVHQTCNTDLSSVWCYNVFCKYSNAVPKVFHTLLLTGLHRCIYCRVCHPSCGALSVACK